MVDGVPPVLVAQGLVKRYGTLAAVDGVDLTLGPGETLGIVGESGCGKSTLARMLLALTPPSEGRIEVLDRDVGRLSRRALRALRRDIQIVFQDPYSSLNPRFRVFDLLAEPWRIYPDLVARGRWRARAAELITQVGLGADDLDRYPSEFSGGQRQRIAIARALALEPRILVCDEPVSALDVSVQAQILNLLHRLREDRGLSIVFISHDLSVVRHMSDRVMVMYLGRVVEIGPASGLYDDPAHPYSRALISSAPSRRGHQKGARIVLEGDLPSPAAPPSGCRFRTRCPIAQPLCAERSPPLEAYGQNERRAACHFAGLPAPPLDVRISNTSAIY